MLLILSYLLCPYESKLYDFCRFFFLNIKHIEPQTLVSLFLLTSIVQRTWNIICIQSNMVVLKSKGSIIAVGVNRTFELSSLIRP
jgi:hypothetical protein